jgi:hypothetical protein
LTSPHIDPVRFGHVFGRATVTVDVDAGDCVVHTARPGRLEARPVRLHLHSLDELDGAYQVQWRLGLKDELAADIARALKFAGQRLNAKQRRS